MKPNNNHAWEQRRLGDVASISKGQQLGKLAMLKEGSFYVLNGGMTPSGYTDKYNTKENTISISEGGNSCGFVAYNTEKYWSGGHNYTLTNLNLDSKFLFQYLKSKEKNIMEMRVGSGLPNIQKTALTDFIVSYPKIVEQEKIGELFSSLDTLITLHQRVHFDLIFNHLKNPNAWEQRRLGDILKEGSKKPVDTSDYPKITISLHRGGVHYSELDRKMADTRPFYVRNQGELIIGKQNYFNGSISIVPKEFDKTICSNAIMSFTISDYINKVFLLEQISTDDYLNRRSYFASGTGQKELSEKEFLNFTACFPSQEEQDKIGNLFQDLDTLITLHQ